MSPMTRLNTHAIQATIVVNWRYPPAQMFVLAQARFASALILCGAVLLGDSLSAAQSRAKETAPVASQKTQPAPAVIELNKRLMEAAKAQQSGDPEQVSRTNKRLIALALREMAHLRLLENALPQASELYQRSLEFEDDPNARVDLAIAYLRMSRPDDAIAEAEKAMFSFPDNARAWNVEGKAWMILKDYRNAAKYLSHSIRLKGDVESAYSLATCLLLLHEKNNAALVFRDIVNNVGESGGIHILIGRSYRDAGFLDEAINEFRRALLVDPKAPNAHYFIGLIELIRNEWAPTPEIRQEMHAELQANPRDYFANYVLGVFTSNEKLYDESNGYLKIAAEEDPNAPEPWIYLGLNAYSSGDMKTAEDALRKSILLTGSDESRSHYQIRKAYIAMGRLLLQTGRKEEGEVFLQKARRVQQLGMNESQQVIAEVFAADRSGMGAVMPYLSKDSEPKAMSDFFSTDPTGELDASAMQRAKLTDQEMKMAVAQEKQLRSILGSGYNDLGTSEAIQKEYSLAFAHFRQAEDWDPQIPNLMRNLGVAAVKVGDQATAARALSKYLETNPSDIAVRKMLGMAYYQTSDYAKAAQTIVPLGDAALNDPGLAYAWAASLVRIGDLKSAARALDAMEKRELTPETLLLVGQTWADAGDYIRASQVFKKAVSQDPQLPRAHFFAGLALLHAEQPAEAGGEFEAQLAISPDDSEAKYNLGYTYLLLSQIEKAATTFDSVLKTDPDNSNAHYQLGKILLDKNEVPQAIAHLEAAERLAPDSDFIHLQLQSAYRRSSRLSDADRELVLYKELKAKNRQKTLPQPNPDKRSEDKP